jgi:hypothetical protein
MKSRIVPKLIAIAHAHMPPRRPWFVRACPTRSEAWLRRITHLSCPFFVFPEPRRRLCGRTTHALVTVTRKKTA